MKNTILILLCLCINTSCENQKNNEFLISPLVSVGIYKFGEIIESNINNDDFEIKTSIKDKKIIEITIKSSKYKTKEGFGVGSSLINIENQLGSPISRSLIIKKGSISIGQMGEGLIYEGIFFIDIDKNGIVDGIWLTE